MSDTVYMPPTPGLPEDNDDVPVSDEVVILLPANPDRKGGLIINVGTEPMRVTTDGSDPTPTRGKPLGGGGMLTLSSPYCPTGEVKAIREGGADTTANASEVN